MSSATTGVDRSAEAVVAGASGGAPIRGDGRIVRQVMGILGLEVRKNLFGARALVMYFLAFAPVGLMVLWNLFDSPSQELMEIADSGVLFAGIYAGYLRTSIFLSTLILFMSLFRSEILQRSLHYYLLTPVRREILVVGKYLAALLASGVVFFVATACLYGLAFAPLGLGELSRHLFQGSGLGHVLAYVGISVLACAGYGAVFLLMGLVMRNPVVAGVFIWGWEAIHFLLPALLKKLSVIYYLKALYPVPLPDRVLSVVEDPISPWLAVPGLLVFITVVLCVSGWLARRLEVSYGGE